MVKPGTKVRIVRPICVSPKHGLVVDAVFEVVEAPSTTTVRQGSVWVMGKAGEPVRLWSKEFEEVT